MEEDDFHLLSGTATKIERSGPQVFLRYQPSGLRTMKFHFLNHPNEDLHQMGSVEYLHAGL